MPWMPAERSGFLLGVGDTARLVASHIAPGHSSHNAVRVTSDATATILTA
jgi:hypothetical protein